MNLIFIKEVNSPKKIKASMSGDQNKESRNIITEKSLQQTAAWEYQFIAQRDAATRGSLIEKTTEKY